MDSPEAIWFANTREYNLNDFYPNPKIKIEDPEMKLVSTSNEFEKNDHKSVEDDGSEDSEEGVDYNSSVQDDGLAHLEKIITEYQKSVFPKSKHRGESG